MDQNSTKLGLQAFKIVCATLFLFAICTNCGFVIKPSVFKGTNSGELQISYTLIYAGSTSSSQTLYYPVNVALQCPAGGRVDPIIIEQ